MVASRERAPGGPRTRYHRIVPVTGPLQMIQAFANTPGASPGADQLGTQEEAAAWLRTAGLLPAEARLSNSEHAALLRLRESMRPARPGPATPTWWPSSPSPSPDPPPPARGSASSRAPRRTAARPSTMTQGPRRPGTVPRTQAISSQSWMWSHPSGVMQLQCGKAILGWGLRRCRWARILALAAAPVPRKAGKGLYDQPAARARPVIGA